jgi:hypothetical protein
VFSTVLSLVFVPAMFMMMDDLGSLIWRYGRLLLASQAESEHPPGDHHTGPPSAKGPPPVPPAMSPAAE